jgi:hypothetical protein
MKKNGFDKSSIIFILCLALSSCSEKDIRNNGSGHIYNGAYSGKNLDRIAFPVGGIGAGFALTERAASLICRSVINLMSSMSPACSQHFQLRVLRTEREFLKDKSPTGRNSASPAQPTDRKVLPSVFRGTWKQISRQSSHMPISGCMTI